MNTQLCNVLSRAYDYSVKEEKYKTESQRLRKQATDGGLWLWERPPVFILTREFKWVRTLVGFLIFWPVGVFFLAQFLIPTTISYIKYLIKKLTFDRKSYEKKLNERCGEAERKLKSIEQSWQKYKSENKQYINYVPESFRNPRDLISLKHYVQSGQAYTMEQAINLWVKDRREMYEESERNEKERERDRQYKEALDKLSAIEANQREIIKEQQNAKEWRDIRFRSY